MIKIIKRNPVEILKLENTTTEFRNFLDGIRFMQSKERISKLKAKISEVIKSQEQKEERIFLK